MTEFLRQFHHPVDVLRFAVDRDDVFALVCVTNIHGGSMRAKGALMAVTVTDVAGYISNGCVDGCLLYTSPSPRDRG